VPFGFNIGKSRVTPLEEAVSDYLESFEQLFPFADYLVVNVSSPNTPDLRKLQEAERLGRLLEALLRVSQSKSSRSVEKQSLSRSVGQSPDSQTHRLTDSETGFPLSRPKPILVKIAPDLSDEEVTEIARVAQAAGASGLIATNTTITRPVLQAPSCEEGGLSGRPLAKRATEVMRVLFRAVEGKLPLIGVGGIFSAEDAYARICAGASLVQVYTGLIYEGPFLPRRIVRGLLNILANKGLNHLREAVGKEA
jgi:dihydroorotate dehydrogenase